MPDTITNDQVVAWVRAFAAQVAEQKSALTKLDAAIGDGDHGTNMDRGMRKVLEKLDGAEGDDIGATLKAVGMALVSSVGGASGPLYGTLFMQMGAGAATDTAIYLARTTKALTNCTANSDLERSPRSSWSMRFRTSASPPTRLESGDARMFLTRSWVGGPCGPLTGTLLLQWGAGAAGATELDLGGWTEALAKGTAGVQARGKAELEDKTMVDALIPAVEALKEHAGDSLADALTASADAAQKGMEATIPLVARKGRASYLGERSADHQDPGATSTHLLIRAAADTLAG